MSLETGWPELTTPPGCIRHGRQALEPSVPSVQLQPRPAPAPTRGLLARDHRTTVLRRRCQRVCSPSADGSHSEAGPAAFPGPTFDKAASGSQAGAHQHTVLHDTTGSREKGRGGKTEERGLSETAGPAGPL